MGLESMGGASYIDAFNTSWPLNTDNVSQADDHIRGIKNVLTQSFGAVTGAVTSTHTELNLLDGITGMQDVGTADSPTFVNTTLSGYLAAPEVRAASVAGLKLYNDAGAPGLIVEDAGNVGIQTTNPNNAYALHVVQDDGNLLLCENTTSDVAYVRCTGTGAEYATFGITTGSAILSRTGTTFLNFDGGDIQLRFDTMVGSAGIPTNTLDVVGSVRIRSLPTSAAGLNAGDLWNNSGVVNVA